jgi:colanic acid/amylovoran biosynthesis glycosyltransferase
MKIAFILPGFPRRSETFILSQLEGLVARGHDVVICARRPGPDAIDRDAESAYAACRRTQPDLPESRLPRTARGLGLALRHGRRHPRMVARAVNPWRFGRHALSFAALQAAVPVLDGPSFDIVHCHFGPAGVLGAILHEMGAVQGPLVVSFYGHDVTRYPRQRGPDVYRRLFERAALVLALDPVMRDRLQQLGARPQQLALQPLGVDCRRFSPAPTSPALPPLRLLSVGRLVEKKGLADGIRAVALLREAGHALRYRIAGGGPLEAELRGLVRDRRLEDVVEFLGHVPHESINRLMVESHALVMPSVRAADGDEEGTPTVILEAMACGLPVVATRHAGIPDLVTDGVTGYLADEHDPEALAAGIARLADPGVALRMGQAGREMALQRFETGRVTERLLVHYRSVSGAASSSSG